MENPSRWRAYRIPTCTSWQSARLHLATKRVLPRRYYSLASQEGNVWTTFQSKGVARLLCYKHVRSWFQTPTLRGECLREQRQWRLHHGLCRRHHGHRRSYKGEQDLWEDTRENATQAYWILGSWREALLSWKTDSQWRKLLWHQARRRLHRNNATRGQHDQMQPSTYTWHSSKQSYICRLRTTDTGPTQGLQTSSRKTTVAFFHAARHLLLD